MYKVIKYSTSISFYPSFYGQKNYVKPKCDKWQILKIRFKYNLSLYHTLFNWNMNVQYLKLDIYRWFGNW